MLLTNRGIFPFTLTDIGLYLIEREINMGNFECDKPSKRQFESLLKDIFNNIKIDTPKNPKSRLDIFATAYTNDDRVLKTYAFELKERRDKYVSDYYGKDGDREGWIYERDKDNELFAAYENSGYTPIYVNLYPDGVIRIWDMSKYPEEYVLASEKTYSRHTVDDEGGRYKECKYTLMNRYGKEYRGYN